MTNVPRPCKRLGSWWYGWLINKSVHTQRVPISKLQSRRSKVKISFSRCSRKKKNSSQSWWSTRVLISLFWAIDEQRNMMLTVCVFCTLTPRLVALREPHLKSSIAFATELISKRRTMRSSKKEREKDYRSDIFCLGLLWFRNTNTYAGVHVCV